MSKCAIKVVSAANNVSKLIHKINGGLQKVNDEEFYHE